MDVTGATPLVAIPPAPMGIGGWMRCLRVRHWAHFLLLPIAGIDPSAGILASSAALARGEAIAFSALAFGYLINGVADRGMDASSDKNPLVASPLSHSRVIALLFVLAAFAIVCSAAAPLPVFAATGVILSSGIVYSVGPRLKRYPFIGTLMNATNFAPLLWVAMAGSDPPPGMLPLTVAFTSLLLQNQLLHEAADREEDERGRVVTSVRALGSRGAALAAAVLGASVVVTAAKTPRLSMFALPIAAAFVVFFPVTLFRSGNDAPAMARARLLHRLCCVVAGAAVFVSLRAS